MQFLNNINIEHAKNTTEPDRAEKIIELTNVIHNFMSFNVKHYEGELSRVFHKLVNDLMSLYKTFPDGKIYVDLLLDNGDVVRNILLSKNEILCFIKRGIPAIPVDKFSN